LDQSMGDIDLLIRRLRDVGFAVASVTPTPGGMVAVSGLAALENGRTIFAKTMPGSGSDLFPIEAEGLRALTELGGASTPEVLLSSPDLLVRSLTIRLAGPIRCGRSQRRQASVPTFLACRAAPESGSRSSVSHGRVCR
jgi:hypothetical protein